MNRHLVPVLMSCALLGACSGSSSPVRLSPECESYFELYATYLDKLEATGRFSSERMNCFRQVGAMSKNAFQNPASRRGRSDEQINQVCRTGQKVTRELMQKAENIPNLSQEEFDSDWAKMDCSV